MKKFYPARCFCAYSKCGSPFAISVNIWYSKTKYNRDMFYKNYDIYECEVRPIKKVAKPPPHDQAPFIATGKSKPIIRCTDAYGVKKYKKEV